MLARLAIIAVAVFSLMCRDAYSGFEKDVIETSSGAVEITFIGHGTLMLEFAGKTIHIDPFGRLADYARLPKADLVLITHKHRDHLDADALSAIRTPATVIIVSADCEGKVEGALLMANGEQRTVLGIAVKTVPAYNLVHERSPGVPFHPKGEGNGYVLGFGDTQFYVAGDTENIPEMKALKGIDVAFLPMNLPYTMTPEMVADAARAFQPKILYPYHYGDTDPARLVELLVNEKSIEVRIRKMK